MRKTYLLIFVFSMAMFASFASKKIDLAGNINEKQAYSLIIPLSAPVIDDYVQAHLDEKTVSIEFIKLFRMPVTITVFDHEANIVSIKGGIILPRLEQLNLNHCGKGKYKLLIEDYVGTCLYGDFSLEY